MTAAALSHALRLLIGLISDLWRSCFGTNLCRATAPAPKRLPRHCQVMQRRSPASTALPALLGKSPHPGPRFPPEAEHAVSERQFARINPRLKPSSPSCPSIATLCGCTEGVGPGESPGRCRQSVTQIAIDDLAPPKKVLYPADY